MADELKEELVARLANKGPLGGSGATIGATPSPTIPRRMLELLTGYPASPEQDVGMADLAMAAVPFAGISKLPISKVARMARATEQGFTTPVWHGTRDTFSQFRGPVQPKTHDFGIHVATTPATANRAIGHGLKANDPLIWDYDPKSNILPLLARIQKSLEMPDVGLWKNPRYWLDIKRNQSPFKTNDPEFLQELIALAEKHKYPPKVIDNPRQSLAFQQDLLDMLQKRRYDSIKYPNKVEGLGEPSYLILDPRNLRSVNATFDPAKLGKTRDLLASILTGVGAGSVARTQRKMDNEH
jgi:hypothetical protein